MSADKRKPFSRSRKAAKQLKKAVEAGEPAAIERCRRHMHSFDPTRGVSLMHAQHVVAREAGFMSWSDMLHSKEKEPIQP